MSTAANENGDRVDSDNRVQLKPLPSRVVTLSVIVLVLVLIGELAYSVAHESLTWDEGNHIWAGYMSWKGDLGMNPEHPPLVKAVATLPLLFMKLKVPELQNRYFKHESSFDGRDLIYGNDAATVIFRVRMAAMIFIILLALVVFAATREMFGDVAGLIALGLLVFEPNLLAHGALVTTDMGITCFFFASVYAFYRYVKKPTLLRLLLTGLSVGVGLAVKHSGLFILPTLALLAASEVIRKPDAGREEASRPRRAGQFVVALAVIGGIAVVTLWSAYGFRYAMRPAGLVISPTLSEFAGELKPPAAGRAIVAAAHWHLLPEAYLYGVVDVKVVADATATYLFGTVYPRGQWFYFPALFVIKATVPVLILLVSLPLMLGFRGTKHGRELVFLCIPPALYFVVAIFSGLNIGVRHILPIFPFVVVLAAYSGWRLLQVGRGWRYLAAALLLFHVVSSVRAFPVSYIPYSNELWGGPSATYKYVSDSNSDWGQQLIATKKYVDERGIRSCWFAYFAESGIRFSDYGIPCKTLPTPDTSWFGEQTDVPPVIDGPVFISASDLAGYEQGSAILNPYRSFQKLQPAAVIENGVFVFEGRFEVPMASALGHVQRARRSLGGHQMEEALLEAQAAAAADPAALQPQMALGDVLAAMHRDGEARVAYEKALAVVQSMEPQSRDLWTKEVQGKLAQLKP